MKISSCNLALFLYSSSRRRGTSRHQQLGEHGLGLTTNFFPTAENYSQTFQTFQSSPKTLSKAPREVNSNENRHAGEIHMLLDVCKLESVESFDSIVEGMPEDLQTAMRFWRLVYNESDEYFEKTIRTMAKFLAADEMSKTPVFKKWQQEANFYPDVKLYRATSKARQREVKDAVKVANEGVSSTLEATGVTYVRLGRGSCYRFVHTNGDIEIFTNVQSFIAAWAKKNRVSPMQTISLLNLRRTSGYPLTCQEADKLIKKEKAKLSQSGHSQTGWYKCAHCSIQPYASQAGLFRHMERCHGVIGASSEPGLVGKEVELGFSNTIKRKFLGKRAVVLGASPIRGGGGSGGWFDVAVLKSDGTPIAQHRWRRKAILSLKPGANKTCDLNVIQELLRQYRESGTIEVARKKDKKKKKRKAEQMIESAALARKNMMQGIPGVAPMKGAVPRNNPHLGSHASFSSLSSSSSSSSSSLASTNIASLVLPPSKNSISLQIKSNAGQKASSTSSNNANVKKNPFLTSPSK